MEIKKCGNCGSFISSDATLCEKCSNKIMFDNTVLKNYFDENTTFDSVPSISAATGISPSTVQNYMLQNNFIDSDTNTTGFSSIQY